MKHIVAFLTVIKERSASTAIGAYCDSQINEYHENQSFSICSPNTPANRTQDKQIKKRVTSIVEKELSVAIIQRVGKTCLEYTDPIQRFALFCAFAATDERVGATGDPEVDFTVFYNLSKKTHKHLKQQRHTWITAVGKELKTQGIIRLP